MSNYIEPEELKEAYEEALEKDVLTDRLARMFMLIAVNYAKTQHFVHYQPKDILYSEFMEKMCKVWKRIKNTDSGRGIFSWITVLAHRTFLHTMMQESKYVSRFINMGLNPDEAVLALGDESEFIKKNGGVNQNI